MPIKLLETVNNNGQINLNKILEATAKDVFSDAEPETSNGESIEDILNECEMLALDTIADIKARAKHGITDASAKRTFGGNPLFVGPTGAGKTSIVSTWARDKGYELISLNMMGDALDFLGVKTINRDYELVLDDDGNKKKTARVSTVATQAFDPFLTGKLKILFLDEINKVNPTILQALYDLISFHTVKNGDETMFLPKLLFVVGAMNPSSYGGGREVLDSALKARMTIYQVTYDIPALRKYMLDDLDKSIQAVRKEIEALDKKEDDPMFATLARRYEQYCGRRDLADAVLTKKLQFTAADAIDGFDELDPVFTPRTFEEALRSSDGTKLNFIKKIRMNCGIDAQEHISTLLTSYVSKDHKANKIWGKDYGVKSKDDSKSAEDQIFDAASDEDKNNNAPKETLLHQMSKLAKGANAK